MYFCSSVCTLALRLSSTSVPPVPPPVPHPVPPHVPHPVPAVHLLYHPLYPILYLLLYSILYLILYLLLYSILYLLYHLLYFLSSAFRFFNSLFSQQAQSPLRPSVRIFFLTSDSRDPQWNLRQKLKLPRLPLRSLHLRLRPSRNQNPNPLFKGRIEEACRKFAQNLPAAFRGYHVTTASKRNLHRNPPVLFRVQRVDPLEVHQRAAKVIVLHPVDPLIASDVDLRVRAQFNSLRNKFPALLRIKQLLRTSLRRAWMTRNRKEKNLKILKHLRKNDLRRNIVKDQQLR